MKNLLKTNGFVLLLGMISLMAAKETDSILMWTQAWQPYGVTGITTPMFVEDRVSARESLALVLVNLL